MLIYDMTEKKVLTRPTTDPIAKLIDKILFTSSTDSIVVDCNCIRNNSMDRAKILIKYLRKHLKLRKKQITFIRASSFTSAEHTKDVLEYLFSIHDKDDVLLYSNGHGVSDPKRGGWFFGDKNYLYYEDLREMFRNFSGRLAVINDCCYSLRIDSVLKHLSGRYVLFGPARNKCVAMNTVLDSVIGYWFHKMKAQPKVAAIGLHSETLMDIPAYVQHPGYYNCGLGSEFKVLKTFKASNAPSLRRGADIDHLFFPV